MVIPSLQVLSASVVAKSALSEEQKANIPEAALAYIQCQQTGLNKEQLVQIIEENSFVYYTYIKHITKYLDEKQISQFDIKNYFTYDGKEYCKLSQELTNLIVRIFNYYDNFILKKWSEKERKFVQKTSSKPFADPLTLDLFTQIANNLPQSKIQSIKNILRKNLIIGAPDLWNVDYLNNLEDIYQSLEQYLQNGDHIRISIFFREAATNGHTDIVKMILNSPRFDEVNTHEGYYLQDVLWKTSNNGHADVIKTILESPNLDKISTYYNSIGIVLGEVLCNAIRNGHTKIVEIMMQSPRFTQIPAHGGKIYGHDSLGTALNIAAGSNFEDIVRAIINNPRFSEINANGSYSLAEAFNGAARNGNINILQMLMEISRFSEINANGWNSLGAAVCIAAENGQTEALKLLMENNRFSEIDAYARKIADEYYSLAGAFCRAAEQGSIEVLKIIMENSRFAEIYTNGKYSLAGAFCKAAEQGSIEVLKIIMEHPRFYKIMGDGTPSIGMAFCLAVSNGYISIVKTIMDSSYFAKIDAVGFWSIGSGLCSAAGRLPPYPKGSVCDYTDIFKAIMEHPRFNEINVHEDNLSKNYDSLEQAFFFAVKSGFIDVVKALIYNQRFKEISEDSIHNALAEINLQTESPYIEIKKLIEQKLEDISKEKLNSLDNDKKFDNQGIMVSSIKLIWDMIYNFLGSRI